MGWKLHYWTLENSLNCLIFFWLYIAFDLVYTEVIVRYALQCQMNIYFLEFIINKVTVKKATAYESQNEALKDISNAQKFLKELNESSFVIVLVLLITTLHTTNCTVSLLSIAKKCTHLQTFLLLRSKDHSLGFPNFIPNFSSSSSK